MKKVISILVIATLLCMCSCRNNGNNNVQTQEQPVDTTEVIVDSTVVAE